MIYRDDKVFVDGEQVVIKIYGRTILASQSFKYLGVVLDSTASYTSHAASRESAFERAAHLLLAGLSRIPCFTFSFLTYIWSALVKPTMCYGMDLFSFPTSYCDGFRARERKWWRKLLQVGGRSPNSVVQIILGDVGCDITWQIGRATLLLKMLNAPAGSWQQLAVVAHHHLQTPWFTDAIADLQLVLHGVSLRPTFVRNDPFLSSTGRWTDEGVWLSFHAHRLPTNMNGCRFRPKGAMDLPTRKAVKSYIKQTIHSLRVLLVRRRWSTVYEDVVSTSTSMASSKLTLLAQRLQMPGPPLHLALDLVPLPSHRSAIMSLFCADWALGKHAHNYFAKALLPSTQRQLDAVHESVAQTSAICLCCWHFRRKAALEDEFHIVCVCPEYQDVRDAMMTKLAPGATMNTQRDMLMALSGLSGQNLEALGSFLAQVRQRRRRLKVQFERYSQQVDQQSFVVRKAAWRFKGKYSCRHGVLFRSAPAGGCKCMTMPVSLDADWEHAVYMPALCHELKIVVAVPFVKTSYERLAILRARAARFGW